MRQSTDDEMLPATTNVDNIGAFVDAVLEIPSGIQPSWAPWQLFFSAEILRVFDVAQGRWEDYEVAGRQSLVRIEDDAVVKHNHWWIEALPQTAANTLAEALGEIGSDGRVSAIDFRGDSWVVAVNDRTDSRACHLIFGTLAQTISIELPLTLARSISGVALCEDQSVIIVDNYLHVARRISSDGLSLWSFGRELDPGADAEQLFSPSDCVVHDGEVLIANEMSGSITVLAATSGELRESALISPPSTPTGITVVGETVVVTDAHRGEVSIISGDKNGWARRALDTVRSPSVAGPLSFPRSLVAHRGLIAIADTARGRVVWLDSNGHIREEVATGGWPRSLLPVGSRLLVADGLGSRLLWVTAHGVIGDLALRDTAGRVDLSDPHHLAASDDGYWLVDSALNDVLLFDDLGEVSQRWINSPAGNAFRLDDPHQVLVEGDSLLIVDTNHGRILRASSDFRSAEALVTDLDRPRFVVRVASGWMVSDHHGLLHFFSHRWALISSHVLRCVGSEDFVNFSDPPRAMLHHDEALYVADWERGVVYRAPLRSIDRAPNVPNS